MPVNPGSFRHLVDIVGPVAGAGDGGGGRVAGTTTVVLEGVWAMIEGLTGTEQLRAMQTSAEASHRITLREWHPGITAAMWVEFEGRTFKIVAPPADPLERRETLELLTREEAG